MPDHYHADDEIAAVVEGFENCTTSKEGFTHLSHLTVAAYYLRNSTPDEALQKMRSSLLRFLDHHDVARGKYSEQVTRAWIARVREVIEQTSHDASLIEVINAVLDRLGDSRIAIVSDDEPN